MISAVLMPNHIHMILPIGAPGELHKLHGLLGAVSRKNKVNRLWQPIPPASVIPDTFHLRRQVRYVALNPCRKGLCSDPLEWFWSTYREALGATVRKTHGVSQLAQALGDRRNYFEVRFHAYVSGDPSVNVSGTPYPKSASPKGRAEKSIEEILSATAAALQIHPNEVRRKGPLRKLFVHLAVLHGWSQNAILSEICRITPRAVRVIRSEPPPPGIDAASLCLGDPRLRNFKVVE